MRGVESIELGRTPPSLNRRGRDHPMKQYRLKSELENELWALLLASKLPKGCEWVHAKALLRFPVRRRRDEGNFRWLLEKALGDALQNARNITDDTPAHFRFGEIDFDPEPGAPRTLVMLTYEKR